MTLHICM